MAVTGYSIRIRGQVQGVGFRPFVWQLARDFGITGEVRNDAEGVLIAAFGASVDAFAAALPGRAPRLAVIEAIEVTPLAATGAPAEFRIVASRSGASATRVTPDVATCPECASEIRGTGRRGGYAFTNCTHCGPRFTILRALPYDRGQTTMAAFPMCPACRAEYDNPADRRFHAQPIACPDCGPRLWLELSPDPGTAWGALPPDPIAAAAAMLGAGGIVAVKGLGGFHLACDARSDSAVQRLRARKRRPGKPFAVMVRETDLAGVAEVSAEAQRLLGDPAAPVVLVPSCGALPDSVAPGMASLGVLLPYTPLHHLLLDSFAGALVMTSANLSGGPQVIGNDEARGKLAGVADAFLMHDRDIARRLDDSVARAVPPMILRRARGMVPGTFRLPEGFSTEAAGSPQVLAMGGQMKAAFCLVKAGNALLSHHLGELDEVLTAEEFDRALVDYAALFDHRAEIVACDLHRGYRTTALAEATGLPVVRVQHHHAHAAACMAEAGWPRDGGKVAAIVLDGLGLGTDGTIWGGEVLLADYAGFTRVEHLRPAALAGGDMANRQPWRNALVRLDQAGLAAVADRLFADRPREVLRKAVAAGLNAPVSSSAGRLFDAVAAMLGICGPTQTFEGEAAMRLEALVERLPDEGYAFGADLDPGPVLADIAQDMARGIAPARIAERFHVGLAAAFADAARRQVECGAARAVALSGGCMQNAWLERALVARLAGLTVLTHRRVPANDGGLALGQAAVALAQATR